MGAAWAALVSAAMTAGASAAPSLPMFEFKGVRAGAPADLHPFRCKRPRPDGIVDCKPRNAAVAGIPSVPMVISFHRGLLSSMFLEVPWADFHTLEAAFTEKYGPPTTVEHPRWDGATGPVANTVETWRFGTGRLTLTQDAGDGEFAEAVYAEDAAPTPSRPVVDF
jgi:hypothetical protein